MVMFWRSNSCLLSFPLERATSKGKRQSAKPGILQYVHTAIPTILRASWLKLSARKWIYSVCLILLYTVVEVERTPKYRTLNTSNIDTPNFEHFEHDCQILKPKFEQARPNIELLYGLIRPEFLAFFLSFEIFSVL